MKNFGSAARKNSIKKMRALIGESQCHLVIEKLQSAEVALAKHVRVGPALLQVRLTIHGQCVHPWLISKPENIILSH